MAKKLVARARKDDEVVGGVRWQTVGEGGGESRKDADEEGMWC